MANNFTTGAFLKKKKKIKRSENLGKTVDMSLVDELVVRRSGAALMNAEEVLLGNIYELIQKGDTKEKKSNSGFQGGSNRGHLKSLSTILQILSNVVLTRFVRGVAKMLRSESLPIWVLWVRRQPGVQVCAKHMHEDLRRQTRSYCDTTEPQRVQ